MLKRDLIELLKNIKDNEEIQFESIIETGRGCIGDWDCGEPNVFFNEDDNNWRFCLSGDESSDSGWYE